MTSIVSIQPPQASPATTEFVLKISVPTNLLTAWARRHYGVDHVEPSVAATAYGQAMVPPFDMIGGGPNPVRTQVLGVVRGRGR